MTGALNLRPDDEGPTAEDRLAAGCKCDCAKCDRPGVELVMFLGAWEVRCAACAERGRRDRAATIGDDL